MYVYDDRYYKLNQTFLRIFGLWPFKKTKFERFRAICFFLFFISYVIVQLTQFVIADLNVNVVLKILSDALPAMLFVVEFNLFFSDTKEVKQIMEQVINDWQMLIDAQEIKIAEHYARQGKKVTIVVTSFLVFTVFVVVIMGLLPDILDFSWPLNESRTHYFTAMNEYHADERMQFYCIFLYGVVSIFTGAFATMSISTMLLSFILHCCALLKISCKEMSNYTASVTALNRLNVISYRIEHAVDEKVTACPGKRNVMVERIIRAVELHRNARKLSNMLFSSYAITFLIMLLLGLSSLSINLFRLLRALMYMDNFFELGTVTAFVIGHQLFMFGANYSAQLLTNHVNELFNGIYRSMWYIAPVTVQRLLLFMMQNSTKNYKLSTADIFFLSLQDFISFTSMSMSYVTMMYSIH